MATTIAGLPAVQSQIATALLELEHPTEGSTKSTLSALALFLSTLPVSSVTTTNWNNATQPGVVYFGVGSGVTNSPATAADTDVYGCSFKEANTTTLFQVAYLVETRETAMRFYNGTTWSAWTYGLTSDNFFTRIKSFMSAVLPVTPNAGDGTMTLDISAHQCFDIASGAFTTRTIAFSALGSNLAKTLVIKLTGNKTTNWPGAVSWIEGSAPVLGSTATYVTLLNFNGSYVGTTTLAIS